MLGKTGDWFCDSCGGECVCDLISLNEGSSEISPTNVKECQCGCQDDKLDCECGCSTSNITPVSEAGDIFKSVECPRRCAIPSDANDEIDNNSCSCGCAEIIGLSQSERDLGRDCECVRGGEMQCKYCCCVDSIQETFPNVEKSLRETETENLAKILERDAVRIGKKNNALQQLVAQYTAALGVPGVVEDFRFATAFCPHHDPTPIRPTLSGQMQEHKYFDDSTGLKDNCLIVENFKITRKQNMNRCVCLIAGLRATIGLLRAKNQTKDEIIAVLADNLIDKGVDAGKVVQNLATPNSANACRDFDRCRLYSYLNGLAIHEQTKNEVSHVRTEAENDSSVPDPRDIAQPEMPWSRIFLPSPRNFRVVKQICNDCLLVAWTPPKDTSALNGYEILVNGCPALRVRSPVRSEAILVSLDTSGPLLLALYSLGCGGISSRPLKLTYAPCFCIDN
ncbi:uncharacterized protein LOC105693348 isoform X1 [Athalia rosae]|uniref:uncharacterized protein LOC105693348 isoform X1 n=1 Tax=Athalia rosae TaxID=37344 RepID=UPI0020338C83|nr:uncharacterized protein LOC105693348 isoform X1 [Athalia rosae]